ncbi:hypothetical protein XELAEV_18029089mg [Xenopus laevis]|uniref:Uncharacterized protein n=1 Tax=Xenopus laevis TaxID=8355 RepID=A0A974CBP1_XENLA|nr:hypothetical protein XELAEV_18037239mg [Xenopus laevis]OCT77992.1 hypothetical protein XELAEV_18029089mg [Xenopus laevis]
MLLYMLFICFCYILIQTICIFIVLPREHASTHIHRCSCLLIATDHLQSNNLLSINKLDYKTVCLFGRQGWLS